MIFWVSETIIQWFKHCQYQIFYVYLFQQKLANNITRGVLWGPQRTPLGVLRVKYDTIRICEYKLFNYRLPIYQRKMLASNNILLCSSMTDVYDSVHKWFSLYKVAIPDADWKSEVNYENVPKDSVCVTSEIRNTHFPNRIWKQNHINLCFARIYTWILMK